MKKIILTMLLFGFSLPSVNVLAETPHDHMKSEIVSEMMENQMRVEAQIEVASETETLYSYEEILEIPASAFPKSTEHEVEIIKEMIRQALTETGSSRKIPLSMVYIDKSEENSDAILSGGGLPYCLDDNGWGPANFLTSDCDRAMLVVPQCIYESIIKKPEWRYCRADLNRNCSPRIGHSPYWHTH
ncbi:hypothetical protein PWF76_09580 [Streptococcus suis]|uniref:hypothetical protein n=1 Tax=Streptococcus suis TaxID=1307 RepID=UPI00237CBF12|nr:hypothetical protein [Streptococcus suis]MDE1692931.1 hypothetical protein [Streptococcus suis]